MVTAASFKLPGFDQPITQRFTGHEMLDDVGLIHMNGRIFDPHLARFMQADPFIQAATHSQSYNRYSYTFNNPLNATDPSGYIADWVAAMMWVVGSYAAGDYARRNDIPWLGQVASIAGCMYGYCAAAAFGSTYGATQNLGVAMIAGISAGALSGMDPTARFLMSGMLGGTSSVMMGGKFGHGFISAGLGSLAGMAGGDKFDTGGLITSAVVGGTISEMTGGKFKNGAASAAFAYAMQWGASKIGASGGIGEDVVTTAGDRVDPSKINPEDIARPEIDYSSGGYRTYGEAMEVLELNMIDAIKDGNTDWEYGGITVAKDGRYYISNIVTSHNESAIFWSVPTLNKIASSAQISGLHHYHPIHNGGVPRAFSKDDTNTFNSFRKNYGADVKGIYLIDKHGTRRFDGTTNYKGIPCVRGIISC